MFSGLMAHFSRIGGVLIRPRATLLRIIGGEGNALEIVPWVLVVVATIVPTSIGHGLLLLRARFFDGLVALLQVLQVRMLNAFFGVLVAAVALHAIERIRRPPERRMGFDRALDVCAFMLVPFLLLTMVGFVLAAFGLNLWWMPHNRMLGDAGTIVVQVIVAFGWSLMLFAIAVRAIWTAR
jgi:hypothetical protein